MRGVWRGDSKGTGAGLCRILRVNFREFLFHALRCITARRRAGATMPRPVQLRLCYIICHITPSSLRGAPCGALPHCRGGRSQCCCAWRHAHVRLAAKASDRCTDGASGAIYTGVAGLATFCHYAGRLALGRRDAGAEGLYRTTNLPGAYVTPRRTRGGGGRRRGCGCLSRRGCGCLSRRGCRSLAGSADADETATALVVPRAVLAGPLTARRVPSSLTYAQRSQRAPCEGCTHQPKGLTSRDGAISQSSSQRVEEAFFSGHRLPPSIRAGLVSLAVLHNEATLASGDEFPMNFEAASFVFSLSLFFLQLFARWDLTSQRTWLARQSGPNKLHRAGPMGLAYGGAIILTWRYYQCLMYIRPMNLRHST